MEDGKPLKRSQCTKDIREMRKSDSGKLQEESRNRYRKTIEEMPLLGYMKTGDPSNKKRHGSGFFKVQGSFR